MSKPHGEITQRIRTEYWLTTANKKGDWADCGQYKGYPQVLAEIGHLKRNNPKGAWACVERTIAERIIELYDGRNGGKNGKNGKK